MAKKKKPSGAGGTKRAGNVHGSNSKHSARSKSRAHGDAYHLEPDREQLAQFIPALFKHATPGTWVSLRAFPDKGEKDDKAWKITPHKLNGDFDVLIDKAYADAKAAANAAEKIVFCPPIATFDKKYYASRGGSRRRTGGERRV